MKIKVRDLCLINNENLSDLDNFDSYLYLNTSNITDNIIDEYLYINSKDELPSRAKRKVKPGDTIISTVRPIQRHFGLMVDPKENLLVSTAFTVLRPNKELVDAHYFYYYMTQPKITHYLQMIAESSVSSYPSITSDIIGNIELDLPSLSEQKKIISKINTFQSKVESNNNQIKLLQEYSQLIFHKWFVDFNFPDKEGKPYRDNNGQMVKVKGKNIPLGWKYEKLNNYLKIINGISYTSEDIENNQGIPMISLSSFNRNGGYKSEGLKYFSNGYKKNDIVEPYDLCIACTDLTRNAEVIGSPLLVPDTGLKEYLISMDVVKVETIDNTFNNFYLNQLYSHPHFKRFVKGFTNGTNVLHLDKSSLLKYRAVIPNKNIIKKASNIFEEIERKKSALTVENELLTEMKDLLIHKLIV